MKTKNSKARTKITKIKYGKKVIAQEEAVVKGKRVVVNERG